MTSPLDHGSHIDEESCYSSPENRRIAKAKNWESIRYKCQLDYKEKLKMERESYLKEYAEMKKVTQKQPRNESMRPVYQIVEEQMLEPPRNATVPNEQVISNSHRLMGDSQKVFAPTAETRTHIMSTFNGSSNIPHESRTYYHHSEHGNNPRNNVCESVDLTKDCENNFTVPRSELKQIRIVRDERGNQITNDSESVAVPGNLEHGMQKKSQSEDFDFSIPFNESNILIKVMTPERKTPINPTSQQQPGSLLQETLQYKTEPKQELSAPKRISFDEESKTINIRTEAGSGNQWLQYIQNILNKTCDRRDENLNNKSTIDFTKAPAKSVEKPELSVMVPRDFVNHRPVPIPATMQQSNVANRVTTQTTNYHDAPSSAGRIKQNRPVVSNLRVVKPKVMHPSPYFCPNAPRNLHYVDQSEDPISVAMPGRRHLPLPTIRRLSPQPQMRRLSPQPPIRRQSPGPPPHIPQHMEHVYRNPPNYAHDFMVRSRRLPMDVPHGNVIGPPVYSPYEHSYMQYHNEMEGIPQPYIDPYNQHNLQIPPLNRNIGFPPIRPSVPGVYRYLIPQHIHPAWIYPHMLER